VTLFGPLHLALRRICTAGDLVTGALVVGQDGILRADW
jgi:hypothetical protein